MNRVLLFFASLIIITSPACVYRMNIEQGNQVEAEKLAQLKEGMTRSQVNFLLGSAAINDQYHANQANYLYYIHKGKEKTEELKTMTLTYQGDILVSIEGGL